ncbi:MAG TPA: M20/M25/M40 family metallo-hydrolase, partial [Candidatus Sulfotelmatobacter sp.]|nr:M20/M25/M40 family metallo-hydrolase [Candidatus Sulfotelmatobacter sp.]
LRGTVRAVEQSERERLLARIEEVARNVSAAARCEATFERGRGCPPVVNDERVADVVRAAAIDAVGEEQVLVAQPVTVGDDVACLLQQVPGCYFLVGAGDQGGRPMPPHHHPEFDIDERCLRVGVETMSRAALGLLQDLSLG